MDPTDNCGLHPRIREHPEPPAPHLLLRELVQQTRGIDEMDIIIACTMGEEEVHVRERSNVIHARMMVALWIGGWGGHISFRIDRVVVQPVCHCDSPPSALLSSQRARAM